jgi:uncharacterized protein (DUF1330 family)
MALLPTDAQIEALLNNPPEGSVRMINLLKFKAQAEYDDGTNGGCRNGMEAYMRYGAALFDGILKSVGAKLVFSESVFMGVIGDAVATDYDLVAIMQYPSVQAFQEMTSMPAYQQAAKHRDAGLASQLLICCSGNAPS